MDISGMFGKPRTIEVVAALNRDGDRWLIRIEAPQEVSAGDIVATEQLFCNPARNLYIVKSVHVVAEGQDWAKLIVEVRNYWPHREED